jgi:hypothetical protein
MRNEVERFLGWFLAAYLAVAAVVIMAVLVELITR